MTLDDHLMVIAMEECAELAQRFSKALRFGMEQIQEDADDAPQENPDRLTNRERIMREYYDLRATMGMLGLDAWNDSNLARCCESAKTAKIKRYLDRSRRHGRLTE